MHGRLSDIGRLHGNTSNSIFALDDFWFAMYSYLHRPVCKVLIQSALLHVLLDRLNGHK